MKLRVTAAKARAIAKGILTDDVILDDIQSEIESAAINGELECHVSCENQLSYNGERSLRQGGFHFRWIPEKGHDSRGFYLISWTDNED